MQDVIIARSQKELNYFTRGGRQMSVIVKNHLEIGNAISLKFTLEIVLL
jgi:hypothetical protein